MALPVGDSSAVSKKLQDMINASLAANPNASKGGYEGTTPMIDAATQGPSTGPGGVTSNSPIPGVDPFAIAQANDAYNRALASVNSRRGSTLSQYGFKAGGFDDSGNPTDLEVDPLSQYGSYQQLLDKQAQDSIAAEDAGAGRGFSGGLANQGESRLRYTQGGERLNLGQGLLGGLGTLNQELLAAKEKRGTALTNAYLDPTRTAIDSGDWTPYETTPLNPATNTSVPAPYVPAAAARTAAKNTPAKATVLAKKVTANRTGATYVPGRGVISIH